MPVKLKDSYTPDSIPVYEMKDGQIGVITEWECGNEISGTIVQRYYNNLIRIGAKGGRAWSDFFSTQNSDHLRVRLLKRGELIEIQDN